MEKKEEAQNEHLQRGARINKEKSYSGLGKERVETANDVVLL